MPSLFTVKRSFHSLILTRDGRYLAICALISLSMISEGSLLIGTNSGMHREIERSRVGIVGGSVRYFYSLAAALALGASDF
jgi:hypothetical protein